MYHATIVAGSLGSDPEMRCTPRGVPVTGFFVATSNRWVNSGGTLDAEATWLGVRAWRRLA